VDIQDTRVNRVDLASLDIVAYQDIVVHLASLDIVEYQDLVDIVVHQEDQDIAVFVVHQAHQDLVDIQEQ